MKAERVPPFPGKVVWQCNRCGYVHEDQKRPKEKCPECEGRASGFREVPIEWGVENARLDHMSDASTAHLRKKIENCFNYSVNPKTQATWNHRLELKRVVVREGALVLIDSKCATCSLLYGRTAIPVARSDKLRTALSKAELKELGIELPA